MKQAKPSRLVLDLGGTKLAVARVVSGRVFDRVEIPTPAQSGPEGVVEAIWGLLKTQLRTSDDVIGVASTGRVVNGVVHAVNQTTMPGWGAYPLAEQLRQITGCCVEILNDAHAAAYGEWRFGAGRNVNTSFMFVTVSTGIGGGLVVGGRVLLGAHGLAGHLGFLANSHDQRVLERCASGTALAAAATRLRGQATTARDVVRLAAEGDTSMDALLESTASDVARALRQAQWVVDPERIAIGGGLGLAHGMLPRFKRHVEMKTESVAPSIPSLVAAELGIDAGLIGMAAWLEDHFDA